MRKNLLKLLMGLFCVALLPLGASAFDVTLDSMSPSDVIDISDMVPSKGGETEVLAAYSYGSALGTNYEAEFTVTGTPQELLYAPFLLVVGAKVEEYTYSTETNKINVSVTTAEFTPPGAEGAEPEFVFVFIGTVDDPDFDNPEPTLGPPHAMAGGYVAMTILDWQVIPPQGPEDFGFGVSLSGQNGTSGFFNMYMPPSMLDLMSTMSGKEITLEDLALFIDNKQASISVTELNGGAFFDINITFADDSTATTLSATSVTKEVVAKEKQSLSAAFKDSKVKKGKNAKLYGWLKADNATGKDLKVYRKKKGASGYKLIATVQTTNENGYYSYRFETKKKGTYYYKVKNASGKKASLRQTLVIN